VISHANILVRRGKGYLPTQALIAGGPYVLVEPLYIVNLDVKDMVQALKQVIAAGHPRFPNLTKEQWQKRKDPVLQAAGVRSWKELAKDGASYAIEWDEDRITLYISRLDLKGRFETDPTKTTVFPNQISLETIVGKILEDVHSRSELLDRGSH
jgi:hypothetical protein